MRFWIEPDDDGGLLELKTESDDSIPAGLREKYVALSHEHAKLLAKYERERVGGTELEDALTELRAKYDREVVAHRQNVQELTDERWRRIDAEKKLAAISSHFMALHNIAKDVVGPKPPAVTQAGSRTPPFIGQEFIQSNAADEALEVFRTGAITREELDRILGL